VGGWRCPSTSPIDQSTNTYPENPRKLEGKNPTGINAPFDANAPYNALGNGRGVMAKRAAIYVRVSTDKQTVAAADG
jgi:hypothetical protein